MPRYICLDVPCTSCEYSNPEIAQVLRRIGFQGRNFRCTDYEPVFTAKRVEIKPISEATVKSEYDGRVATLIRGSEDFTGKVYCSPVTGLISVKSGTAERFLDERDIILLGNRLYELGY